MGGRVDRANMLIKRLGHIVPFDAELMALDAKNVMGAFRADDGTFEDVFGGLEIVERPMVILMMDYVDRGGDIDVVGEELVSLNNSKIDRASWYADSMAKTLGVQLPSRENVMSLVYRPGDSKLSQMSRVYQFNSRWIKSSTAGFTQFSFSVSDFIHRGVPMRSLADALGHDVLPWSTWDASNHLLVSSLSLRARVATVLFILNRMMVTTDIQYRIVRYYVF